MLARGIAMHAGMHISLGDYARGGAAGTREAQGNWRGAVIGSPLRRSSAAGIDLLTVFARARATRDAGRRARAHEVDEGRGRRQRLARLAVLAVCA